MKEINLPFNTALPFDKGCKQMVYLLQKEFAYEGNSVVGVFATEEAAKEAAAKVTICKEYLHLYEIGLDTFYEEGV